jgi:hypothetical protein
MKLIRLEIFGRIRKAIDDHVAKLKRAKAEGKKVRYTTLYERTGVKFGSGVPRHYRRAAAKRALAGRV